MLDQVISNVITTIVTALIAVPGTLLATRTARKTERRKKVRESIEEIYTLSDQVRIWVHVTLRYLYKIDNIDHFRDVIPAEYLEDPSKEPEYPINRLKMLIALDAPSLTDQLIEYMFIVAQLRNMKYLYDTHKSKSPLDYYITGVIHNDISKMCSKEIDSAAEFLSYVSTRFNRLHAELQASLSKLAQKN